MLANTSPLLAIHGGSPVRKQMLPYGHQLITDADLARVGEVLRSDYLTTGPAIDSFERALAARVGKAHVVAVSNGTAALQAAISLLDLSPDQEVITTPISFIATANCIRYAGAKVVFADVRRDTLNLDPSAVAAAITSRTRAIIAVDYTGAPADYQELQRLAARYGLILIADAAHSLGAEYRGVPSATAADLATFSFHPVKHITCGEGGAVATARPEWAERLRRFRNHGIDSDYRQRESKGSWYYEMRDLGFNLRLSDIQCALAESQLGSLNTWLEWRRQLAARYARLLCDMTEIELPRIPEDRISAWHLYVIRLNLDRLRTDRAGIFRALRAENIGVNVHYIPIPWHPYYEACGYRRGQWPVAESEYNRLITLPLWAGMTDRDQDDVVEAVRKVITAYQV